MDNDTSLWSKKQDEVTVGDSMKIMGVAMIVSIVAPVIVGGICYAGMSAYEKLQEKRRAIKANK